jgi:hypothetical protein
MIQHPVVEGFEPDADILSIHIARIPKSARHARYRFKDRPKASPLPGKISRCETRKTNMAHAAAREGRSIHCAEKLKSAGAIKGRPADRV